MDLSSQCCLNNDASSLCNIRIESSYISIPTLIILNTKDSVNIIYVPILFASLQRLTLLLIMISGKASLKRSLPFQDNLEDSGSIAMTLLSLQSSQQMEPAIPMATSKVLLQHLFETKTDAGSSTQVQGSIRDAIRTITSYLWPRAETPVPKHQPTPMNDIPLASYGPTKKRLKTRYYLESQSINIGI